ncbi:MAG: MFS transporter [Pseudomonadota bacterium]
MAILTALSIARVPALAFVVLGAFWGAFAASVPDIKNGLGVNDAVFGLLLLGNPVGLVTAMWIAPRFDAALGANALRVVTATFACCFILPGLASTPATFAVAVVALGITSGLTDILMNARVSDLEARHGRTLMNVAHGMFSLSYAVSAILTGFLRADGNPPWVALGAAAVFGLVLSFWLRTPPADSAADGERAHDMPWGIVLICGAIVLAAFSTEATVETWSALHIERTLGGDPLAGSLGPVMLGLTMAVGRIGGQGLSDRFRDEKVLVVATLMTSAGAFLAAAAETPAMAYLGFGILGLGVSVIGPLGLAAVGRMVPPEHRTEAIAKVAVMGFSGFFFAPVFMGFLSELYSLRVAYAVIGGIVLINLLLTWQLARAGKNSGQWAQPD